MGVGTVPSNHRKKPEPRTSPPRVDARQAHQVVQSARHDIQVSQLGAPFPTLPYSPYEYLEIRDGDGKHKTGSHEESECCSHGCVQLLDRNLHAENTIVFGGSSSRLAIKMSVEQVMAQRKDGSGDERGTHQGWSRPVDVWHLRDESDLGSNRSRVEKGCGMLETVA